MTTGFVHSSGVSSVFFEETASIFNSNQREKEQLNAFTPSTEEVLEV
jgi:hypothetical protein